MKSLLIKDFKLMKNNIKYIIIGGLLLTLIFLLTPGFELTVGSGFLTAYMGLVGMINATRTVTTDQENNSSIYLFSLPVSRKSYVLEKYIFCILIGIICTVLSLVIVVIISFFKPVELYITLYTALTVFSIMLIICNFLIPVDLKFNKFQSRIIGILIVLFVMFFILLVTYLIAQYGANYPFFKNMTYTQLVIYLYIIAIIITFISIKVSETIINKKEF